MQQFNLAAIHEALADTVPDRECLVHRDRRISPIETHGFSFAKDISSNRQGCQTDARATAAPKSSTGTT